MFQVSKRLKCHECIAALYKGNINENRMLLIIQKSRGGLVIPANDVLTVCHMTEFLYRQVLNDISEIGENDFSQNLALSVFSCLSQKNLFNQLYSHSFDSEDNHIPILIKTISLCFIRIRNFHETKKINLNMIGKNKRKLLTRLFILQNV